MKDNTQASVTLDSSLINTAASANCITMPYQIMVLLKHGNQ